MKTTRLFPAFAGVILRIFLCISLGSFAGCETIKKIYAATTITASAQASDSIIVAAEKSARIGKDAMDTYLDLESRHREAYAKISPKIHEFAVWLRTPVPDTEVILPEPGGNSPPITSIPRGISLLKTLRRATKTFKANRTPQNEANLRTAWRTVEAVIEDCKKYTQLALTKGQ